MTCYHLQNQVQTPRDGYRNLHEVILPEFSNFLSCHFIFSNSTVKFFPLVNLLKVSFLYFFATVFIFFPYAIFRKPKEGKIMLIHNFYFKNFFNYTESLLWHMGSRAHRLSTWGTWVYLPHSIQDLSSPIRDELVSSALGGGFLTTGPPGKSVKPDFQTVI